MSTILLLAISIAILNLSEARLRILSIGHGSISRLDMDPNRHSVILGLFMDPIAHRSDCTPTQLHTDPIVHRSDCAYSIRRNSDRKKENIK